MKTETQIAKENLKKVGRVSSAPMRGIRMVQLGDMKGNVKCQEHKASCQRFLEFLERNYANFTWEGLRKQINPMQKKITDLKQVIKLYEDNRI